MTVAIIGSGFSGSLLAWILASQDVPVTLIDSQTHPRFAIGESSTPIADAYLRRLGRTYNLQPLVELSTYSTWKRSHPKLTCGKKRGFSYYHHQGTDTYCENKIGDHSLLVTASKTDAGADTHWYRSEVDQYFFQQAILSGAIPHSATSVVDIEPLGTKHRILCQGNKTGEVIADHLIDATGPAAVTAKLLGKPNLRDQLQTQTSVRYGHFQGVRPWRAYLQAHGMDTSADPFDPDNAAQHHIGPFEDQDGGWTWMLRFDNDITSIGFCSRRGQSNRFDKTQPYLWMMQDAKQVSPIQGESLIHQDWVQTYHDPVVSERIWMMPTAACTMDPLHSTGIAHGLAGVERLAQMILSSESHPAETYAQTIHAEVAQLDGFINTAYQVMDDPRRFHAACMVYFIAAIASEEAMGCGEELTHLYGAGDTAMAAAIKASCQAIQNPQESDYESIVSDLIAPWNTAGLMSGDHGNRYAYTATKN